MNFLQFVQYSAENLQFYLWLVDYEKRWKALPQSMQELSPVWDQDTCSRKCAAPPSNLMAQCVCKPGKPAELLRSPAEVYIPFTRDRAGDSFYSSSSSRSTLRANDSIVTLDTSIQGVHNPPFEHEAVDIMEKKST